MQLSGALASFFGEDYMAPALELRREMAQKDGKRPFPSKSPPRLSESVIFAIIS